MNQSKIIVGIDGSPASQAAALWAAAEAVRRDTELVAIHVYDWRSLGAPMAVDGQLADDTRVQAEARVQAAVEDVRGTVPSVRMRGEALLGPVVPTLVRASEQAGLMVVGSRGRGGFGSLLLGSVGQQVVTHAASPVVVVRGRPGTVSGPVVVGTDGSESAQHAVGMAFEEAAALGTSVVALRSYAPSQPTWDGFILPYVEDGEQRRAAEYEALKADVEQWAQKYPDVAVACSAVDRLPADALVDASTSAQLVVVGTRGHGGFAGLLLGSVGLHILHHTACPVLIVRPHKDAAE